MPKNVLHILGSAGREGTGIASIVSALARGLNPDRYKVHAWFLAGQGPLAPELQTAGASVRMMRWSSGARDPVGAWGFWRGIRGEDFAIIHQHFGGRAPRRLARAATRAKVITHVHSHTLESRGLQPLLLPVYDADLAIATSQAVADCISGARARVVYPGVEIPYACDSGWTAPRAAGEIVMGTAGRLVPLKGIVYLIRALALLCQDSLNFRLEIAGSGPERTQLEREVQLHGLEHRVRFLGWQSGLAPLLAGWDVYVQPSLAEPFGIAALEAMAAGLPVVATSAGGLPELVEHGRTGWLVPPREPTALADVLRALLLDPGERHRRGMAGRGRAQQDFSMDRMIRTISDIYDDVLNGRGVCG